MEKHMIDQQFAAEQTYLKEFRSLRSSFEAPFVRLNPYLITPLTAVIAFYTETKVPVTMTVAGLEPAGNITKTFPPATEHVCSLYLAYIQERTMW